MRPLSVTRCLLPATTLVNDNSDDKPRQLALCVNSLSSCATRHRVGNRLLLMASADHQGHRSLTIVYGSDEICRRPAAGKDDRRGVEYVQQSWRLILLVNLLLIVNAP